MGGGAVCNVEDRCTLQHFGGPRVSSACSERMEQFSVLAFLFRASRTELFVDLSEVRGAFLYGWHQGRLLYAPTLITSRSA